MSVLIVGASHNSAPIDLLERMSLDPEAAAKLATQALDAAWVSESAVVATCNRVEVYVEADRFHGAVDEVTDLVAERVGLDRDALINHMYVHYDDAAVEHLFSVAAGLDSMVLGESEILGQVRQTLTRGQDDDTVGTSLNALFQQALRIAKRCHAETGIDRISLVDAALAEAGDVVEHPATSFLVAGAGATARLAMASLVNAGVDPSRITVSNRTGPRAAELAHSYTARSLEWDLLDTGLGEADVLICGTGATSTLFDADRIARARDGAHGPLTIIDLALPRDVDTRAGQLAGVSIVDLEVLSQCGGPGYLQHSAELDHVRSIVTEEVSAFLQAKHAAKVTPTVVALRSMATEIVESELSRARGRLSDLSESDFAVVEQTVRRVSDKLLHDPTVRVQQLAGEQPGLTYADALADLFALDSTAVAAVTDVKGDMQ